MWLIFLTALVEQEFIQYHNCGRIKALSRDSRDRLEELGDEFVPNFRISTSRFDLIFVKNEIEKAMNAIVKSKACGQ